MFLIDVFIELDPRLSILIWVAMFVSLAVTCTLPRMSGIWTLVASILLRMIFSFGIQPTLWILGCTMVWLLRLYYLLSKNLLFLAVSDFNMFLKMAVIQIDTF